MTAWTAPPLPGGNDETALDDYPQALLNGAGPEPVSSWLPVDITAILDGSYNPPRPELGRREDGQMLIYPGRVHTVSGETESGKTWLILLFCLQEILAGHHVAYLDFEDTAGGVVSRLRVLGAEPAIILEYFHYAAPREPASEARISMFLAASPPCRQSRAARHDNLPHPQQA